MNNGLSSPRGLLPGDSPSLPFTHRRYPVSAALSSFAEHFWSVEWAFEADACYEQLTLPHPTMHLVIDPQRGSALVGPVSQIFKYTMKGRGAVLGIKMKPAAMSSFTQLKADSLRDNRASMDSMFEIDAPQFEKDLLEAGPESLILRFESALLNTNPHWQEKALLACELVKKIESASDIFSVEALANESSMSVRALQRLFSHYIGVTPSWVIERYRMIEAVEQIRSGEIKSLTELAQNLGYFDQAHFSKTFTRLLGYSPSELQRRFSHQDN